MNKRAFKNFITRRSTIWTLSLCITGILVLGGIAALNGARNTKENKVPNETEQGQMAYLEENASGGDMEDELFPTLKNDGEDMAQASGSAVSDKADVAEPDTDHTVDTDNADNTDHPADNTASENTDNKEETETQESTAEVVSGSVVSEQALIDAGVNFTEQDSLLWPSAGTILIDYSMDGSVYFPTLDQYKYNPALIIESAVGNQVLASAKGIVESIRVDDVTGITLVLNIGNGYKLTYGQLKELAVAEGDVVEEGTLLGYVSEPTKYYTVEGSNLYFGMTQNDVAVDPVLYLE